MIQHQGDAIVQNQEAASPDTLEAGRAAGCGLLLCQVQRDTAPLETALDAMVELIEMGSTPGPYPMSRFSRSCAIPTTR